MRNILLVGVGGQGVVLASNILGEVAVSAGWDVKKSEVHGMAKRGGIVFSHVRFGPEVHSPMIAAGEADAVVAFEWAEGVRWLPYLRPGGLLVVDTAQIVPPAAQQDHWTWQRAYPRRDPEVLRGHPGPVVAVDARRMAQELGSVHVANTILLGALSLWLEFPPETWEEVIPRHVPPRTVDVNLRAFRSGRALEAAPVLAADPWEAPPRARRYAIDITPAWCKGCDICVRLCPEGVLELGEDRVVRAVAPEACTGCHLCEWLCPDFAIAIRPLAAEAAVGDLP